MFWWLFLFRNTQELSSATKAEIARRVSRNVYQELQNNNYLESSYILEVATEIAKDAFELELIRSLDSDTFSLRAKLKDSK